MAERSSIHRSLLVVVALLFAVGCSDDPATQPTPDVTADARIDSVAGSEAAPDAIRDTQSADVWASGLNSVGLGFKAIGVGIWKGISFPFR